MNKYKKIKLALFTILFTVLLVNTCTANSLIVSTIKSPNPYSGNSSWFQFYQYPGKTIDDTIVLRNVGDKPETVRIYATDATVNQAGSFTPKMENEEQKGIGSWTNVNSQQETIEPGETKEVDFHIDIPANITPGQYFGSIILEQIDNESCPEEQITSGICPHNIQIRTRTGNRIYLTIPGETIHDIKVSNFDWKITQEDKVIFTYNIINNGNVAFQPKVSIDIYDFWGKRIDSIEQPLGKSLPGSTTSPMVEWDFSNKIGKFSVNSSIFFLEENMGRFDELRGTLLSDKQEASLILFPYNVFLVGGIGSILIFFLLFSFEIRKRYLLNHSIDYKARGSETIMDIAEKFNCNWKTIARLNHIKAPYILASKQIIKVPQNKDKNDN